jgi:uncharacterized glyoxalase superfamily protein PhnB
MSDRPVSVGEFRVVRRTDRYMDARAFYVELLGWPVTKEWPRSEEGDDREGCVIAAGANARIEFLGTDTPEPVHGVALSVQVDDIDGVVSLLRAAGVSVDEARAQPWGHRNTTVIDPSGIALTLFEVC